MPVCAVAADRDDPRHWAQRTLGGSREWRSRRSGRLTTNFAEAGAFFRSQPGLDPADPQLHIVIGKLINHGRKPVFGHRYNWHAGQLHPKRRRSVQLASADPLAAPLLDPAFLADPTIWRGWWAAIPTHRRS